MKSSEVGLSKAGLTVTLRKDWLRKYYYTKKAQSAPPFPQFSFERVLIEFQAYDIIFHHHAVSLKKYTPKNNAYDNALFQ